MIFYRHEEHFFKCTAPFFIVRINEKIFRARH